MFGHLLQRGASLGMVGEARWTVRISVKIAYEAETLSQVSFLQPEYETPLVKILFQEL